MNDSGNLVIYPSTNSSVSIVGHQTMNSPIHLLGLAGVLTQSHIWHTLLRKKVSYSPIKQNNKTHPSVHWINISIYSATRKTNALAGDSVPASRDVRHLDVLSLPTRSGQLMKTFASHTRCLFHQPHNLTVLSGRTLTGAQANQTHLLSGVIKNTLYKPQVTPSF